MPFSHQHRRFIVTQDCKHLHHLFSAWPAEATPISLAKLIPFPGWSWFIDDLDITSTQVREENQCLQADWKAAESKGVIPLQAAGTEWGWTKESFDSNWFLKEKSLHLLLGLKVSCLKAKSMLAWEGDCGCAEVVMMRHRHAPISNEGNWEGLCWIHRSTLLWERSQWEQIMRVKNFLWLLLLTSYNAIYIFKESSSVWC